MNNILCNCCSTPAQWFSEHLDRYSEYLKLPAKTRDELLADYHEMWDRENEIELVNDPETALPSDDQVWEAYQRYMERY